ncbi:MAG: MarR family transcriptional regulator [Pigmentiphaga sp.]|uniref:MarR family winged helix-turn-helix transcriptional regulator n=1 Tax=Pigmentiphaga sp. TaxID=1977564 RepID=UPI0029B5CA13|nr:MarR family transcriptional regulator [Pigmentiphaga sp.]MDX3905228.1 MarR family transcriptional regulator [Pigmentiphaga sp.]
MSTEHANEPFNGPSTTYLISQVHHPLRNFSDAILKPYGVTGIQFTVLSVVAHREGLSSADLSRRFYVTPQSMGQLLATLEERGLLERKEDANNRRILRITLTAAGRDVVESGSHEMAMLEQDALRSLSAKEIKTLRGLLRTVIDDLRSRRIGSA